VDRYEVHQLLRQYGEEKLRQTEIIEAVRQVHSGYYLAFLTARDEDIKGRRQQDGLREIGADFENIVAGGKGKDKHVSALDSRELHCSCDTENGLRSRMRGPGLWLSRAQDRALGCTSRQ
jgi:hypothetical protein